MSFRQSRQSLHPPPGRLYPLPLCSPATYTPQHVSTVRVPEANPGIITTASQSSPVPSLSLSSLFFFPHKAVGSGEAREEVAAQAGLPFRANNVLLCLPVCGCAPCSVSIPACFNWSQRLETCIRISRFRNRLGAASVPEMPGHPCVSPSVQGVEINGLLCLKLR